MIRMERVERRGEWTIVTLAKRVKLFIGIILFIFFSSLPFSPIIQQYASIPDEIIAYERDAPISVPPLGEDYSVTPMSDNVRLEKTFLIPEAEGRTEVVYKKGNIPLKKVDVNVLKNKRIIPGGQSIGVQLHTKGVLVVGHHLVKDKDDTLLSPGEAANIQVGDVILEMNGKNIEALEDVKPIVTSAGEKKKAIDVKLKRGNDIVKTELKPTLNKRDKTYQIGLFIRDSATGIGTISFIDKDSGKYGALGHVISDTDTKKPIEIFDGKIVRSQITSIAKGNEGVPGEKRAKFSMNEQQLGTVTKNSAFGIFGELDPKKFAAKHEKPMPIALSDEVKTGKAHILTVVDGEKVEKFDVEIVHTVPQKFPATKGMIIKITDDRLLNKTGGIVQGMSGSPIIQDGKLVGAVTHVL